MTTRPFVCLVGNFSLVAGGQAGVNEHFRHLSEHAGAKTSTIDLSPRGGPATLWRRLSRLPRVVGGIPKLCWLVLVRRPTSIYIGIAGGLGQVYDLLFVLISRLAMTQLVLHHDSFAYLDRARRLTGLIVRAAGPRAIHVVLCEQMRELLVEHYPSAKQVVVISATTRLEEPDRSITSRQRLGSIGFFSNLTIAKGVLEFLDVADRVHGVRPELRVLMAGPIEEPSLATILKRRLEEAPWIEYIGPVYGDAKAKFLAQLDVLLFPTRYVNEAEPAVIGEALAHGVVVIARGRGCISWLLESGRGVTVATNEDFVSIATRLVVDWYKDPELFSSLSARSSRGYRQFREANFPQERLLVDAMVARDMYGVGQSGS